jgi:hypothetical protein
MTTTGQANQQLAEQLDALRQEIEARPVKWAMTLYDLDDASLNLTHPISVVVEEYPTTGTVGISFPDTESYVEGSSLGEALAEIKHEIGDLYRELKQEDEKKLGRLPLRWRNLLMNLIYEESLLDSSM